MHNSHRPFGQRITGDVLSEAGTTQTFHQQKVPLFAWSIHQSGRLPVWRSYGGGRAGSQADRTASCLKHWKSITKDKFLLGLVRGIKLNFHSLPWQLNPPSPIAMSEYEMSLVDEEVQGMVRKGAIVRVGSAWGQFLSSIFLIPKKSGAMRPVINLKNLSRFLESAHFKMEHLLTILPLVSPNCLMTSLDLKDAYFSLPIAKQCRQYLHFPWCGVLYEFQCLCFGLSLAPLYFTKVMKPVFSQLRKNRVPCSYYLDDSIYLAGNHQSACENTHQAYWVYIVGIVGFCGQ